MHLCLEISLTPNAFELTFLMKIPLIDNKFGRYLKGLMGLGLSIIYFRYTLQKML